MGRVHIPKKHVKEAKLAFVSQFLAISSLLVFGNTGLKLNGVSQ